MATPINPTQITPPRVPLIDDRTGAIAREWYRFFLSLRTAVTGVVDETTTVVDASSLSASLDAATYALAQVVGTQSDAGLSELQAYVDTAVQALASQSSAALASLEARTAAAVQALSISPPPKEYRTPRYGSFYDTTTQTAAAINTAYAMTFNTTDLSQGVYIGSPTSRVYVDRPNVYNIQFSAQLDKTSGGDALIWIWLRKNGVNVPDSTGQVRVQGNNSELLAAWNYLVQLNSGDYIEIMWEVDDTSIQILYDPATAVHPAIPSVILTVTDNVSSLEV